MHLKNATFHAHPLMSKEEYLAAQLHSLVSHFDHRDFIHRRRDLASRLLRAEEDVCASIFYIVFSYSSNRR